MGTTTEYPLALVIKAVDKATAPLREINEKIHRATEPVRRLNNSLRALGEESGLTGLVERVHGVGHALQHAGGAVLELGKRFLEMEIIGGFALFELVKSTMEAGVQLGMSAKRVGMGVDEYARLQFAAQQAGVGQDEFSSAMDRFNKNLGLAKAYSGPFYEFLLKVSPNLAEAFRRTKSQGEAFALLQRALEQLPDPAKRAALGAVAVGRGGARMTAFMAQGAAETERQAQAYDRLHGSSEKAVEGAHELHQGLGQVDAASTGLRDTVGGALSPALAELSKTIADIIAGNRESLREWAEKTGKAIKEWVDGGGPKKLVTMLGEWKDKIGGVIDKLGGLKTVLEGLAIYMAADVVTSIAKVAIEFGKLDKAILKTAFSLGRLVFGPVIAAIGNFAVGIWAGTGAMQAFNAALIANPLGVVIMGIGLLAGAAYLIYKHWAPIKKFFEELWDTIKKVWDASPFGGSKSTGPYRADQSSFAMDANGPRPTLLSTAAALAPPAAGGRTEMSRAHVTVAFEDVPRGVRVTPDPLSTAPLNVDVGYSMVQP